MMFNSKPLCLVALLCAVLLGVTGCSSNKRKALKPLELASFDAQAKVKTVWTTTVGDGGGKYYHQFRLASDRQYLYAGSSDGRVFQLDKKSGKKRWQVDLDTGLTAAVAVGRKHVFVGASDGVLIALDKDSGEQAFTVRLSSEMVSPGVANNGLFVVQVNNGEVFAINTDDGSVQWRFSSNMPALTIRGTAMPVFFANFVAIGTANGKIALLDRETGQLRGEPKIANAEGDSEIERIVDVDGQPLIYQDVLYAVSYQGQISALDLKNGQTLWSHKESSYKDLAQGFNHIYVVSDSSAVLAYADKRGDLMWVQERLLRRKLTSPTTFSSYLIVADFKGYIHVLAQSNGAIIARTRIDSSGVRSPVLADGEYFYVLSNDGKLKAFRLQLKDQ